MKYLPLIFSILFLLTSCFPTDMYEPEFEYKEEFHDLAIPAEGYKYDIPFIFFHYVTRTTRPSKTFPIRARFLFDDIPGEVYDTAIDENPIQWNNGGVCGYTGEAIMHAHIPANESSAARTVAVQISIDSIAQSVSAILEEDEHKWGEWITILDGIQRSEEQIPDPL